MPPVEPVEDPEDPRLADYRDIRDAQRRLRTGTFIAEGRQVVRRLLEAGRYRARSALVTPPALEALGPALDAAGVRTFLVQLEIVQAIVGLEFHHGCLAVGERGLEPSADAVFAEARTDRVVVLEDLGDASNVGAIFRNALALGAGAILLSPTRCTGRPSACRRVRRLPCPSRGCSTGRAISSACATPATRSSR